MKKRGKKNKSILLRLLVVCVCGYLLVKMVSLCNTLSKSIAQRDELIAQFAAEKSDVEELKILLREGSEAQLIERAARDRLGFVYSDEQVFIDISGN